MTVEDRRQYFRRRPLKIGILIALCLVMLVLCIYSISINSFSLTMEEAWGAVLNRIRGIEPSTYYEKMVDYVAIEVNSPRTIIGVFVGAMLAISGAIMQTVTRNALADPYTIGISSAALFGVTISIIYGICIIPGVTGDTAKCVNAFVFAMIPAVAIIFISTFRKLTPTMMILVGIGLMYLFSSFTTMMKFNASEESLQEIYEWSLGTLSELTWSNVMPVIVVFVITTAILLAISKKVNILTAGDNVAQSLGENPLRIKVICFVVTSIGVAICVCYTGTIGFVGLVAPHIARIVVGNNVRSLIIPSALIGALFIIVGDIIVRSIPGGLPVGVITALIGSPLFIYFLFKGRKAANF